MSSPLDGRIRHIAREVLAEAGHPAPDDATSGTPAGGEDRLAQLEEQVATLTGRASDQWSPSTGGVLGIEVKGNTTELEIRTWRIP